MSVPTRFALVSLFAPSYLSGSALSTNGVLTSLTSGLFATGTTDRNNNTNGFIGKWSTKNFLTKVLSNNIAGAGKLKKTGHLGLYTTYHRPARGMFVSRHAPRSPPANPANASAA